MEDLGREAFEFTMGDGEVEGGGGCVSVEGEVDWGGIIGQWGTSSLEGKGETRTEEEKRKALDDQVGLTVG